MEPGRETRVEKNPDGWTEHVDAAGVLVRVHRAGGVIGDPPDGAPAVTFHYPGGAVGAAIHAMNGRIRDAADGTPAFRYFY